MSIKMTLPAKKMRKNVYQAIGHISELVEGDEYFSLKEHGGRPALQFGTIYLCGHCKKPASVNTGWISGDIDEEMRNEAKVIGVVTELSHDDRFDDPDVCEDCSMKGNPSKAA